MMHPEEDETPTAARFQALSFMPTPQKPGNEAILESSPPPPEGADLEDFDVASLTTRHSYFSEGVPDKAHILCPPNRILHDRHARLFEGMLKESAET
eukprot:s249_g7.t1